MKNFFIIVWLNVKDLWKNNRFLFCLILAFMFLSFSFITIASSVFSSAIFDNGNYRTNTFSINIKYSQNMISKLDKFLKKENNILCAYFSFSNPNENEDIKYKSKIFVLYDGIFCYGNQTKSGHWFTEKQIETGEKVIIVPNYEKVNQLSVRWYREYKTKYELNTTYNLDNEDYTIIGEATIIENVFIIPFNSLSNKNLITTLNIAIKNVYNEIDTKIFGDKISKTFNSKLTRSSSVKSILGDLVIKVGYIIVLSLGVINLKFVYEYLMNMRKNLLGLFKLYGLNKKKCLNYLMFEFLIWITVCFVLSTIFCSIFLYINRNIFNKMFRIFSIWEYIFFYIAYVFIYYTILFPSVMYYVKSNNEINLINDRNGN